MLIILSVFCWYMISNVFCFCKGDKKKKKKSGSGSITSSNSHSSTPTIATDCAANTIAAAATTKLSQDRPGTCAPVSISPLFSGYVDEIVWSDHIDETYLAKPSLGTISFTVLYKLAFWMLFDLFPISFMFPVLKQFFELSGFL